MATTGKYEETAGWQLIVAGEKDINLCAPENRIFYWVGTSIPTDSDKTMMIRAKYTHPVKIAVGENLYIFCPVSYSYTDA